MDRRTFVHVVGIGAICSAALHADQILAESTNADDAPFRYLSQSDSLEGIERAVYRSFEASESGFMDLLTGGLVLAVGIGLEAETSGDASRAVDFLSVALTELYTEKVDGTPGETVEASVGRLGDERVGLATTFSLDDEEILEEFTLGTIVVRQDRYLQILIGASTIGPLSQLATIADDVESRWPSDDIWMIVPDLADMPVGMVLDEEGEFDIGVLTRTRESTDETSAESGDSEERQLEPGSVSFTVELQVSGLYLDADGSANVCSGAGFYRILDAGSEFTIVDRDTDVRLYSAILSPGTLEASSCAWTIAVLGLPPRPNYTFLVGHRQVGSARIEEIQPGITLTFEIDK